MNLLNELQELGQTFIAQKNTTYRRYFIRTTPLQHRFTIILGERGIGKTTTIVQYLLSTVQQNQQSDEILYIQADHFLVQRISLYEIAEAFVRLGGKTIAFDEIHKYPNWSMELKSIYDTFPGLRILASGSSALEIHKGSHDLSRRALTYQMVGLSLREFIELEYNLQLPTVNLVELLQQHRQFAEEIVKQLGSQQLKILKIFQRYLTQGYYPYYREFPLFEEFKLTLEQNLHTTIEADLVAIYPHLTGNSIKKIKQLLIYIAQSVPFTPNWKKIRSIVEIADDRTLKTYFKYLEDAYVIHTLEANTQHLKRLEIPSKVFIGNTNQLYTLASQPNLGNLRETFFISMLLPHHQVTTSKDTDFCVDQQFHFEVGGKKKNHGQIYNLENSYLALDDLEYGSQKRIPLWLFGFLY